MFPRPGKSGKCKRGGLHDARSISPTIASTESPEILCNPFCLPSPAPAHQNDSDDSCLDVAKHLICELPNIYLIPPNGDPLKTSICVWNSKFDGILSSFLDSDPSTPLATPVLCSALYVALHHLLIYPLPSGPNGLRSTGSHSQVPIRR